MAAYAAGSGREPAVLAALAGSRLLVPVLAMPAEDGVRGPSAGAEKHSEMATAALVGQDGRRALVAFTCADAIRRWQPAARPVPVPAAAVFQAAAGESSAV